jgi:hypothetical protein
MTCVDTPCREELRRRDPRQLDAVHAVAARREPQHVHRFAAQRHEDALRALGGRRDLLLGLLHHSQGTPAVRLVYTRTIYLTPGGCQIGLLAYMGHLLTGCHRLNGVFWF